MLKILFNEKSNATSALKLTVNDLTVTAEVTDGDAGLYGKDTIEALREYNSYALITSKGKVKVYRAISRSDYRFIDLARLGVATRMDFADIIQLYGTAGILQVDTGIIGGCERDIIISVFQGTAANTVIDADTEYETGTFSSDDLVTGDHPRDHLWDSYALEAGGTEYRANRRGEFVTDPESVELTAEDGYINFTIRKYRGAFDGDALTRDIDDDEVVVESSCGLVNNRRVALTNGAGTFRLYPFGYEGMVKIKLGRRWYPVWNEYNLVIGG